MLFKFDIIPIFGTLSIANVCSREQLKIEVTMELYAS
jgi:hypothetical protein